MDNPQGDLSTESRQNQRPPIAAAPDETQQPPSLVMSAVGAAIGAGAGALVWFGIAYVLGIEFGYVAILVGSLAGWGAVWLGRVRNEAVGCIAAVAGVVGILLGSYGGYHHGFHIETAKAELRQEFYYTKTIEDPGFDYLSAEQKEAQFERAFQDAVRTAPGYFASLTEEPFDLLIMLVFGGLGLYYGYRVGSGQSGHKSVWT